MASLEGWSSTIELRPRGCITLAADEVADVLDRYVGTSQDLAPAITPAP